jgi:hypothetical protein
MEPRPGDPETMPSESHMGSKASEDELAREMIERIARQVDLESGRVPLEARTEAQEKEQAEAAAEETTEPPSNEPAGRSEEDVSRELVERIAREVDEEPRG